MKPSTRTFYEAAVRRAVSTVVEDLDEVPDIEALAKDAACSLFHFHRIFRGMVGETPLQLHRRLRFERAAHVLASDETPVIDVALDAGYDSHEGFTRAFHARFGHAPVAWRQRARERDSSTRLPTRTGIHYDAGEVDPRGLTFIASGEVMHVEIVEMEPMRLAVVRHTGPYYLIGAAFSELRELASREGVVEGVRGPTVAVYHDDTETTPAAELRSDAGVVVAEELELPQELAQVVLPGGRYARWIHAGSYASLGDAWGRFMGEWFPASGERVGQGTCFEVYRNDPHETPEDELVTELYVALA